MKISDFNFLDEPDAQRELLRQVLEFNRTQTDYPRSRTVHSVFAERATAQPDAVAVALADRCWTYRELRDRSSQVARFIERRGIVPGSVIGVMMEHSFEVIASLLGILKAGCGYLPLDFDSPPARTGYILRDAGSPLLISKKRFIREVNRLQWDCPALDAILCLDSRDVHGEAETVSEMMREDIWRFVADGAFDDISGGGWTNSYTGEWLSREVMDGYARNIETKLDAYLNPTTRVLEVGCASGISMFLLAPRVGLYYGTDLSGKILEWSERERCRRGLPNIRLQHVPAHCIHEVPDLGFDLVIINSVAQCFSGHNYFRDVLRKSISRMSDSGHIFLGNVWDLELKEKFVQSLSHFQRANIGKGFRTKTDRNEELFLSRRFLQDLQHDLPEIVDIEFSLMIGQAESELSQFGFDALLKVEKKGSSARRIDSRYKSQFDARAVDSESVEAPPDVAGPRSLAYLMYTSGTSGQPKGVLVEHRGVLRLVLNTNYAALGPGDRILQTGALSFDASTFEIWGALLNGGTVCLAPEHSIIDPDEIRRLLAHHKITTMWLTTSLFNQVVEADVGMLAPLRLLLTGGERASSFHFKRVLEVHPHLRLVNGYGPTENTTFTACHWVTKVLGPDIPIGAPISNTTVFILDEDLSLVPIGAQGEICAGGDGLARGYLNDPVLTQEKFIDHPWAPGERLYRTGDIGRWNADGTIEFIGRRDDQVKMRGYRVELGEIAACMLRIDGVKEAIVVARDRESDSKEMVAYFTTERELEVETLREMMKTLLPEYMIPAVFMHLERIPLSPNGKADRRALPEPEKPRASRRRGYMPPGSELEGELVAIWEEVLEQKPLGIDDDFFDFGGHSLKVTRLVSRIQEKLGVVVPLGVLFKATTVRRLAHHLLEVTTFGVDEIDSAMVRLTSSTEGARLFAFPPGTGDALGYLALADALRPYAFHAFNFIEAGTRIRDYADLVLSVDTTGPYVLLGYSSGGNLAYHVARELEERGRRVSDVVMVDSGRVLEPISYPDTEVHRVIGDFLGHKSVTPYLKNPVLREKVVRQIRRSYEWLKTTTDLHQIDANIHLLLCADALLEHRSEEGRLVSSKMAWQQATRGTFKTYQASGSHNAMLSIDHVPANAALLRGILDAALSTHPA